MIASGNVSCRRSAIGRGLPLLLAFLVLTGTARAQDDKPFPVWHPRTVVLPEGLLDAESPLWRARYGFARSISPALPVGAPAAQILAGVAPALGFHGIPASLRLSSDIAVDGVRHLRWIQTSSGVPVFERFVAISVNRVGQVTFVQNGHDPAVDEATVDARPVVSAEAARDIARSRLRAAAGRIADPTLVVLPGPPPRLAWQVWVWPDGKPAEWLVLVDATTGGIAGARDETVTKRGGSRHDAAAGEPVNAPGESANTAGESVNAAGEPVNAPRVSADTAGGSDGGRAAPESSPVYTDGSGAVFDPDPLATSGARYGPPYVDGGDADSPELRSERRQVVLRDITRSTDGLYRLEGPHVRIVGENSSGRVVYVPPSEVLPTGFAYTRADDGFEAVSAYYHLDSSQRYVQSLGFLDLQATALAVNPAGTTADDSGWIAGQRFIFFGTGGVDDAEDAFVLWHEYAHALLEGGSPGLRTTLEGQALHEGWSDYWAASYQRSLVEQGAMKRTDWQRAFRWDAGDGEIWAGRMLDHGGHYPESTCSDDASPGACSPHNDGRLWATTMLEVYDRLGREVTDRLNLLSHRYIAPPVTFRDAAAAVVQADVDHYGGAHLEAIVEVLGGRGLLDESTFGPLASHEALGATESLGGWRTVEVRTIAVSSPIAEVTLFHRVDQGPETALSLTPVGDGVYRGELPVPTEPGTVRYWIRAVDSRSRATVLPSGAPAATFSFAAGPDTSGPLVDHVPLGSTGLAEWPVEVRATVTDPIGIAEVQVEYDIEYPDGATSASGSFALAARDGTYAGRFDVPVSRVRAGSTVRYRIRATDRAAAANRTDDPAVGSHSFTILGEGVLRVFDAGHPAEGTIPGGMWAAGPSRFGVSATPGGGAVYGVGLESSYPNVALRSRLELGGVDLSGIAQAWLVFRHWYDTEHDGRAEPGIDAGDALWDGGNVKVSVDGGATWTVLVPEGAYSGTIKTSGGNPMAGEAAFGGRSFTWRFDAFALPVGPDVRLALDFGSGAGADGGWAGWRVDEMAITTRLPEDAEAPFLAFLPAPVTVLPVEAAATPRLSVEAADDVGIADAFAEYAVVTRTGRTAGELRLAVSPTDLTVFEGTIQPAAAIVAGDRIEVRYRLRDFAGRETVYPEPGSEALRIEVRLVAATDVLDGARPNGAFGLQLGSWRIRGAPGALVTLPLGMAANGETAELRVRHAYRFGADAGGRLAVSADDGSSWEALEPAAGYPATRDGRGAWAGLTSSEVTDVFDLGAFRGRTVLFRFETVGYPSAGSDEWTLHGAQVVQRAASSELDLPAEAVLHANFPDPAGSATNISFSVGLAQRVTIDVFDPLGRRVARLVDAVFEPGAHRAEWDVSRIPAGVYFIRMLSGGRRRTEAAAVAR